MNTATTSHKTDDVTECTNACMCSWVLFSGHVHAGMRSCLHDSCQGMEGNVRPGFSERLHCKAPACHCLLCCCTMLLPLLPLHTARQLQACLQQGLSIRRLGGMRSSTAALHLQDCCCHLSCRPSDTVLPLLFMLRQGRLLMLQQSTLPRLPWRLVRST